MTSPVRKRFGQHFLHDPRIIERIVQTVGPGPDEHVVEIGGGHGALTLPLAERVGRLDVVEIDRDLVSELERKTCRFDHVHIHSADALRFDYETLAAPGGRLRIVGNLPYNISTPLLFMLLGFRRVVLDMHLMLQKEVVDRMCAAPGGKDYGRLTVMLAAWTDIEACFDIGPGAFSPPPQVRSTFARVAVRRAPSFEVEDAAAFASLVASLFSMRRKTLRRALKGRVDADAFAALGIDPGARPETLAPRQFADLARAARGPTS
jgi:16S rRNA (adenine1518-N6/adenine1519-N6)-dimethyltransferase